MTRPLHVVHGIERINRSGGGTSTFVAELAGMQASLSDARVTIVTRDSEAEQVAVDAAVQVRVVASGATFGAVLRSLHAVDAIDVLHVHGLWRWSSHDLIATARSLGTPVVLSTHGMLQPDALRTKWLKKRLALLLYQRRDLARVDMLHATAEHEAACLREFGLRQPVAVVPPGLTPPPRTKLRDWGDGAPRTALFFSRLHPIKNLIGLVEAWAKVRPRGWRLVVAGPDTDRHAAAVRRAVESRGLTELVQIVGPRFGDDKEAMFRSASLFVLPSFSENFGIVVAEALAYGVPAITTTGTPWQCVVARGCGWNVPPDTDSLAACLAEATSQSCDTLRKMGLDGRSLVERNFNWSRVVGDMDAAYLWLLGRGPRPACVS